jgi:hypothetical protein
MPKKKTASRAKSRKAAPKSSMKKSSMSSSMSMPKKASKMNMTTHQLSIMYVAFLIAHALIVYVGSMLFPSSIVLGTNLLSMPMAILYSMVVFTLITVLATPVIENVSAQMNIKLSNMHWMAAYFVVNMVGLWIVARYAELLGLGLSSWMVAAALAVVMDFVQGLLVKSVVMKS